MEIGNEISQKLRAVIKTKLKELGSYVDDELPDYIMVMLANKRSQEQMTEDLALFLGSNTAFFTDWLVGIIQKLQDATSLIESPEKSLLDKTGTESVKLKETRTEKADTPPKMSSKEKRKSPHRTDAKEEQKNKVLKSSGHRKNDKPRSSSSIVKSVGTSPKTSVRKRKHSSSDEDDGRTSQLHSIVKIQDRKPTLPPSKQASSSLLKKAVAEAHLSVNKAVLSSSLKYDPTSPPSPIRSHSYEEKQQQKELLLQQHRELQRQLQQMESNDDVVEEEVEEERDEGDEENLEKEKEIKEEITNQTSVAQETLQDTSVTQDFEEPVIELRISEAEALEYSAEPVEGDTRIVAFADSQVGGEDSEEERRRKRKKRRAVKSKKERPSSPKFIVTLDGVGSDLEDKYDDQVKKERKKKKPKKDDTADDFEEIETSNVEIETKATPEVIIKEKPTIEPITFDMDVGDDGEEDSDTSPIKNSLAEKCKFWPECKNGDDCPFFHPTVTCRSFPSCRFGDNCRFIHPPCKFDGRCANSSCPYTHKLKNKQQTPIAGTTGLGAMLPSPSFLPPPVPSGQPIPCKFFPACTKTDCPFFHPPAKPCRFGTSCTRPNCIFSHPAKPSSLKWVSPLLHVSERRFALSEQKVTSMPVL